MREPRETLPRGCLGDPVSDPPHALDEPDPLALGAVSVENLVRSSSSVLRITDGIITVTSTDRNEWLGKAIVEVVPQIASLLNAAAPARAIHEVILEDDAYEVLITHSLGSTTAELLPLQGCAFVCEEDVARAVDEIASWEGYRSAIHAAARLARDISGYDLVLPYEFTGRGRMRAMTRDLGVGIDALPPQAREALGVATAGILPQLEQGPLSLVDVNDPGQWTVESQPGQASWDVGGLVSALPSQQFRDAMRESRQVAALVLPLVHKGRTFGILVLTHRTARCLSLRALRQLEVFAKVVAGFLEAKRRVSKLERQLEAKVLKEAFLAPLFTNQSLETVLQEGKRGIRTLVPCDGVLLRFSGQIHTVGERVSSQRLLAAVDLIGMDAQHSESLREDHPEAAAFLEEISALILVPLLNDGDFLLFYRAREDASPPRAPMVVEPSTRQAPEQGEGSAPQVTSWDDIAEDAFELGVEIRAALRSREHAALAELAYTDPLTGLPNRRFMSEYVQQRRDGGAETIAAVFIDLDDFKLINDRYGHGIGDRVLVEVGKRLERASREQDQPVRLSGDEFVVVCHDVTQLQAQSIKHRILDELSEPVTIDGLRIPVSLSAGLAFGSQGTAFEEILRQADADMYRAKQAG